MEEEVSANENKKRSQDDIYWKANKDLREEREAERDGDK